LLSSKRTIQVAIIDQDVQERGKSLLKQYNPAADEEYSLKFYELTIECLVKWAELFPNSLTTPQSTSKYVQAVKQLVKNKIRLPDSSNLDRYNESIVEAKSYGSKSQRSENTSGHEQVTSLLSEPSSKRIVNQPSRETLDASPTREDWEIRKKIAEGIKAMRDNSAEFMRVLRTNRPVTQELCNQLFSKCISLYSQYKPYFEPIIKSNDQRFQAERKAINDERNFVNNSNTEFVSFKKGLINSEGFYDKVEQNYSKCQISRNSSYNTPEMLADNRLQQFTQVSSRNLDSEVNGQEGAPVEKPPAPSVNVSHAEIENEQIVSRHSSKRPSIQPQNLMDRSISSQYGHDRQPKSPVDFFTDPFGKKSEADDRVSPLSHHNASLDQANNSKFFSSQNMEKQPSKDKELQNSDFFDFSKTPKKLATIIEDNDPFGAFQFPAPIEKSPNPQDFFSNNTQIKEQLKPIFESESKPLPQEEVSPPPHEESPPPVTEPNNLPQESGDHANKSFRDQAFADSRRQSLVESALNASRISNMLMGQDPLNESSNARLEVLRPSNRRSVSNIVIGGKKVGFVDSIAEESSRKHESTERENRNSVQMAHPTKPAEPTTQIGAIKRPAIPQNLAYVPTTSTALKNAAPHLPETMRFSGLPDTKSEAYHREQIYPSQMEALNARLQALQHALFEKESLESRQKRTAEEERLKWEEVMRHLERENRELKATERAREALEKDREEEMRQRKAEMTSLLIELEHKNREILNLQRQVSRIDVEAREKIIDHTGLIEQLKEQYQRVVKDREELTAANAKHMVQAKLYVQEEAYNRELLTRVEETNREMTKLKAELYVVTTKSLEQEKQTQEQVEIIKSCEEQVEKTKHNFVVALKQVNQAHEKDRLTLVESHQHEINRLLTRMRELETYGLGRLNNSFSRTPENGKKSTEVQEESRLSGLNGSFEGVSPAAGSYLPILEREVRNLREENIKSNIDLGFLKEEVNKKDHKIAESEDQIEQLKREIADLKDQNYQKVKDCYSKEKMLNDMSQKYSEMMGKYTSMHRSLEAHQREEAQLRKELNEYHARLMRLSDEKAGMLEQAIQDNKHSPELEDAKQKIENLQRFLDDSMRENVDLKRKVVEGQANDEIWRMKLQEAQRKQSEVEKLKEKLEDEVYYLKQKQGAIDHSKLEVEIKESILAKVEKERMLLAAKLEAEEQKVRSLEKNLESLTIVENLKQELSSIDSTFLHEEVGKFVQHLRTAANIKPQSKDDPFLDQEPHRPSERSVDQNLAKATSFISWDEFNKNYNKFLTEGVLYPSDLDQPKEERTPNLTLTPLAPQNIASHASLSLGPESSTLTFKPHGSFYDEEDLAKAQGHPGANHTEIPGPIVDTGTHPNSAMPSPNIFFSSQMSEDLQGRSIAGSVLDRFSGLKGLVDSQPGFLQTSLPSVDHKAPLEAEKEAELFVNTYNQSTRFDDGGLHVAPPKHEEVGEASPSFVISPCLIEQKLESSTFMTRGAITQQKFITNPEEAALAKETKLLAGHEAIKIHENIQQPHIQQSNPPSRLKSSEIEQMEWTNEDLKMFEGMVDLKQTDHVEQIPENYDFFFGQTSDQTIASLSTPKMPLSEVNNPGKMNKYEETLVENYEFDDPVEALAKPTLKKSFEGVENIIREAPEHPQFKDYCEFLTTFTAEMPDKNSFKESCLSRSGVFCHIKDWNLILKNGSLQIDSEGNKIVLELVIMTQDPITLTSVKITNHGTFC
jgi:hypothetical protein